MYTLGDICRDIFGRLMQENGGVLVYRDDSNGYLVWSGGEKLRAADQIHLLLDHTLLEEYEDNSDVCGQLLSGKLSVRKGGCAAFLTAAKHLNALFLKNGPEQQIKAGAKRIESILTSSVKVRQYLKEHPEKKGIYRLDRDKVDAAGADRVEDGLLELEIEAFEAMREGGYFESLLGQGLICAEPQQPPLTGTGDPTVWDYLALLIYSAFCFMDFSESIRDREELEKNTEKLKDNLKKLVSHSDDTISSLPKPELKTCLEMMQLGYSALDICTQLVENDNALYQLGIDHKNEGNAELWAKFLEASPENFLFMMYDGKIVGNYSLVTLSDDQVALLERGKLYEADFSLEKNSMIFSEGTYVLYILNYSVNIGFSTRENRVMLWKALLKQLERYAEQQIYFSKVYVNIFRADHEALYKQLGFEFVHANESRGRIYCLKHFPYDLNWSDKQTLLDLYEKARPFGPKE